MADKCYAVEKKKRARKVSRLPATMDLENKLPYQHKTLTTYIKFKLEKNKRIFNGSNLASFRDAFHSEIPWIFKTGLHRQGRADASTFCGKNPLGNY